MTGPGAATACLFVRSAGWLCALPLSAVVETLRPLPLTPLQPAVPGVLGVIRLRGRPAPVISTAALLGGADDAIGRYVHVRAGDRAAALAVADVLHVGHLDGDLPALAPLLADNAAMTAIASRDAALYAVLDAARLVPDAAWQAVAR